MLVIGLDVGSSGVKSTVFDEKANVIGHAYREYDLICENEGMFELSPTLLLEKTFEVLEESTAAFNKKDVSAICVTSFGESFICLDENDRVMSNTMIYMDYRGTQECGEFLEKLSAEEIFSKCGQFIEPMFGVYKMRWLVKNKPQMMEKVKRIMFICDFITFMLGAEHCCDYSLASRSAMFDIKEKKWWDDGIAFAGIDKSILPEPVPSGSVVGTMSRKVSDKLGMTTAVKLIVGGHDQVLAALGSGANDSGDIANGMGTVDCFVGVMDSNKINLDALLNYNLSAVPYFYDNMYVTYAFFKSGGCTIKWFRDNFAKDLANLPDAYAILDRDVPTDPTDLHVIPYFAGGGVPHFNNELPAVIAGMHLNTSRNELYKAFLEGETYEMRTCLDCLGEMGLDVKRIITVGGGSKSPVWMQIRADIFGRDVYVPENREAGTLASAMLCYTNLGLYKNIAEAQKDMVQFKSKFEPQKENLSIYEKNYGTYKELYKAVKGIYI